MRECPRLLVVLPWMLTPWLGLLRGLRQNLLWVLLLLLLGRLQFELEAVSFEGDTD